MLRLRDANGLPAAQPGDGQCLDQSMVRMRVHSHSTMHAAGFHRHDLQCILGGCDVTSQRVQFHRQVINTVAVILPQVLQVLDTTRLPGKTGSRNYDRHAIDNRLTRAGYTPQRLLCSC